MSFHRRCESIGICGLRVARQKTSCQGFTLIELLIVVVILGVLGMIALPSFLNQAARAQQTKALNAVGAMNRAQQSFFYENGQFSNSIAELGFAHLNEGRAYRYAVQGITKRPPLWPSQRIAPYAATRVWPTSIAMVKATLFCRPNCAKGIMAMPPRPAWCFRAINWPLATATPSSDTARPQDRLTALSHICHRAWPQLN